MDTTVQTLRKLAAGSRGKRIQSITELTSGNPVEIVRHINNKEVRTIRGIVEGFPWSSGGHRGPVDTITITHSWGTGYTTKDFPLNNTSIHIYHVTLS